MTNPTHLLQNRVEGTEIPVVLKKKIGVFSTVVDMDGTTRVVWHKQLRPIPVVGVYDLDDLNRLAGE